MRPGTRNRVLGMVHADNAAGARQERERARWFDQLFSQTSDVVFVVGPNLEITWWGPRAEQHFGVPADRAVGAPCYELVGGRHAAGRADCGPRCWVMRAAQRGHSVPTFPMEVNARSGGRQTFSAGFMVSQAGEYLVHILRAPEADTLSSRVAPGAVHQREAARADLLTARERQVLALIVAGASSQEIARQLAISLATARNHVQNVLVKLGVHSRLEAALVALEQRLHETRPG